VCVSNKRQDSNSSQRQERAAFRHEDDHGTEGGGGNIGRKQRRKKSRNILPDERRRLRRPTPKMILVLKRRTGRRKASSRGSSPRRRIRHHPRSYVVRWKRLRLRRARGDPAVVLALFQTTARKGQCYRARRDASGGGSEAYSSQPRTYRDSGRSVCAIKRATIPRAAVGMICLRSA